MIEPLFWKRIESCVNGVSVNYSFAAIMELMRWARQRFWLYTIHSGPMEKTWIDGSNIDE